MKKVLILGGGGFIGHNLAKRLKSQGCFVRVVDLKEPMEPSNADEFLFYDLREWRHMEAVCRLHDDLRFAYHPPAFSERDQFDEIYQLAADMGGAGYIFTGEHDSDIMRNSAQINLNLLDVLVNQRFRGKVFYSSSACIYPQEIQQDDWIEGLKESDAYPANPDSEYGWEKIFSERLFMAYARNYVMDVRIARFHNIYGPCGTFEGGKEKAPAAMCRKAQDATDYLEIWGDGHQTRSFLFIEDCLDAVQKLMDVPYFFPVNIGSEECVTINDLAKIAIGLSKKQLQIKHVSGPQGVRGRNSNNELIEQILHWRPKYTLKEGMKITYEWIKQYRAKSNS